MFPFSSSIIILSLAVLVTLLTPATLEPAFRSRYQPPTSTVNNQSLSSGEKGNKIEDAQEYLGIFGWLRPKDWSATSPRFSETIIEGKASGSQSTVGEEQVVSERTNDTLGLTEEEFTDALSSFQHANGLEVTGQLDSQTITVMSQLRCGVPDQTMASTDRSLVPPAKQEDKNAKENHTLTTNNLKADSFNGSNSSDDTDELLETRNRREANAFRFLSALLQADNENKIKTTTTTTSEEVIFGEIPEGQLPEQSRVESIEEVLAALRKEKMLQMKTRIEEPNSEATPKPTPTSNLLIRILKSAEEADSKSRRKRSNTYVKYGNGWGMAFAKPKITWRLMRDWRTKKNGHMSYNEIWFTIKLAFRMWSEVLPRIFEEDNGSPISNVDILIGFGEGKHGRCPVQFKTSRLVSEYAHAWSLPKAEVHFNDGQHFVPVSWVPSRTASRRSPIPISLLKVAVHEIGHTLGLPHNDSRSSVMNPFYQPYQTGNIVELSNIDRATITEIYGTCDISFDVVFDWVRQGKNADGTTGWKYNTYFFRRNWYWLYENRVQRPRYGDPKWTAQYWNGVMNRSHDPHERLDGAVHVRSWKSPKGRIFFFKGDKYTEYDSAKDRTKTHDRYNRPYPRKISDDFPGIPYPIDTVFFNIIEGLLYFFKNDMVYRYHWARGKLFDSDLISRAFPGWGGASHLPNNIDAAYYSYAYQAYYFFKGTYYWKLAGPHERHYNQNIRFPYNAVGPRQKISSKWKYICDVGPSELVLNLPTS